MHFRTAHSLDQKGRILQQFKLENLPPFPTSKWALKYKKASPHKWQTCIDFGPELPDWKFSCVDLTEEPEPEHEHEE